MAKTPAEWIAWIHASCTRAGLSALDADECVSETLLRYHHRRGAYPWDEPAPDVILLRLLARNVAHEYQRACARHQRLERDYCSLQQALMTCALPPEQQAVSNADAERFRSALPTYLQQTLELLEAGYTPAEIAQRLNIRVSTIYTYCRDLKARFIEYFGYDPRISGACVVNYSGSAETGFPNACEEVSNGETTAEDTGHYGVVVSDCESCGDAPHAGGAQRVQRGGRDEPVSCDE